MNELKIIGICVIISAFSIPLYLFVFNYLKDILNKVSGYIAYGIWLLSYSILIGIIARVLIKLT